MSDLMAKLRKDLRIPKHYYRCFKGGKAAKITPKQRWSALTELLDAEIIESAHIDSILGRLCARLGQAHSKDTKGRKCE